MKSIIGFGALLPAAVAINSTPAPGENLHKRTLGTATVTLSAPRGSPSKYASGFIYGVSNTLDQIPDEFYTGMGYNYGRCGGAQTPSAGGKASVEAYNTRFQSALSNYQTTRKYGGRFQLLLHDMWVADGGESDTDPFPGDNRDWTL